MSKESLGIKRLEAVHYYVRDLERSRRFYVDLMDFAEVGHSSADLESRSGQTSKVFTAGDCTVLVSAPLKEGGRASRFLKRHPDGIGTLVFEVEDVDRAFTLIEARGGTPVCDVESHRDAHGTLRFFSVTTPFGDTTFRFVERKGYRALFPGMEMSEKPSGTNRLGFTHFDHITSNFLTMSPALLWMEHVLGLEKFWEVEFHTTDVSDTQTKGSGLKSQVMWDPGSGVRFANNEPMRPFFRASQIHLFVDDHRGDGIQHAAIGVRDILSVVRDLRARGVEFMPTPGSYYDMLPQRIERLGIGRIDEDIATLRDLEILVDGEGPGHYLLQIFLKDSASLYREPDAGPFFFEIIQRKGDEGFGAGNFRALFESIEREQQATGRV
ncbi:MAG: 4-hydroxyphenylpyruvate dioxygenase [Polyangiales bacterium]